MTHNLTGVGIKVLGGGYGRPSSRGVGSKAFGEGHHATFVSGMECRHAGQLASLGTRSLLLQQHSDLLSIGGEIEGGKIHPWLGS